MRENDDLMWVVVELIETLGIGIFCGFLYGNECVVYLFLCIFVTFANFFLRKNNKIIIIIIRRSFLYFNIVMFVGGDHIQMAHGKHSRPLYAFYFYFYFKLGAKLRVP